MTRTIQEIDAAITDRIRAARAPLLAGLAAAAAGQPWYYLVFGSMARGTARRGSDVDIAVVDSGDRWREAERVHSTCATRSIWMPIVRGGSTWATPCGRRRFAMASAAADPRRNVVIRHADAMRWPTCAPAHRAASSRPTP